MHLGGLVMGLTKIRLGDYIERSTINNKDLKYGTDLIVGVNSQGVFAHPKGNTDGVEFETIQNSRKWCFCVQSNSIGIRFNCLSNRWIMYSVTFIYGILFDK